jgi:hypothetical protein
MMDVLEKACDISFSEKIRIFSNDYLKCCSYISSFDDPKYVFTKKLYSRLIGTSQVLEDFLDFHGAKNNNEWYFYRELSAAVRHLSLGGYSQLHISNRLVYYGLPNTKDFASEGNATLYFITSCLRILAPVILHEAKNLNIPISEETYDMADFPGVATSEMLDYNIDDMDKDLQKINIAEVIFEGDVRALEDLEILAGVNYGEDTMGKGIPLPKELNYLK